MGITRIALKRPVSAVMVILAILILGIGSLFGFSMELLPETEMPVLMVHTAYEGADPETVDSTISRKIEEAAETLNGIESIETYSYENYSVVMLQYAYGTEVMSNYLKLQNALAETKQSFPAGSGEPVILEMNLDSEFAMQISASAEAQEEVLAFLGEGMLSELENLPSAAKVEVYGGETNYIRVELKQELLKQYGLEMSDVAEFIAAANFSVPIGTVEQGNQNLGVSSEAKINNLQELKEIPLRTENGGLIRLDDIADISWAVKDAGSVSRMNGEENVTIGIVKSQRADALTLSRQVQEVLESYQGTEVDFEVIYDSGEEVTSAAKTLGITLAIGLLLAVLVIYLLLGDAKSVLTVSGSMLLSLFVTIIGMKAAGLSMNIITMGAMIISVGILLDTSVMVLETFFRMRDTLLDKKEIILEGTKAIRGAVITTVAATVAVCLPLAFLNGFSAKLLEPFGMVILFTAAAAFLDAAVFLPLLFAVLRPEEKKDKKILPKLEEWYDKAVPKLMKNRDKVIALSMVLFALSCAAVIFAERELIAETDTGVVNVEVDFRYGMKSSEVEKKLIVLEELLMESNEVESYSTTVVGSTANLQIQLKDGVSSESFREMLKTRTTDYVGIDINVSNGSVLSALETPDGEEIVLAGYQLDGLKEAARELADRYREIPGVLSVLSSAETEGTKLEITIDSLKAVNYGLTPGQVAEMLKELSGGREVLTLTEEGRDYSVCLEYPEGLYSTPQNLMNASLKTADGVMVPLSEIAELEYTDAQNCITRRDGKYIVNLTVNCSEKYREDVRSGMSKAWNKMQTKSGIYLEETDVERLTGEEFKTLYLVLGAAILLLFFVLTIRFESPKHALTMLLSIPLGLFGAFLLVFLTGNAWDLISMIGLLFVLELIVCHGIRYTERAERLSGVMPLEDALLESGKRMLRPVAVTTFAIIAVMLPMAVWSGAGTSLMRTMTVVMIGGSFSGALLIVLLLPVFYSFIYEKEDDEELEALEEKLES